MKKPTFENQWPEDWKSSYHYDLDEVFGAIHTYGYARMYQQRYFHTLDMVQKVVSPPARVLDVAAAQGNFSLSLAEMGYDVTWNDLRGDLIEYVKLKYDKGTLNFMPGNAFELRFEHPFDAVLITEIIEHVAHPDDFLVKVAQLVRPGGYIVMTTPNGGYFKNDLPKFSECADPSQFEDQQFQPNSDGHIFILHTDEIEMIATKAGLEVVETRLFANFVTNGHLKTRLLLPLLPLGAIQIGEKISRSLPSSLPNKLHSGMSVLLRKPA